MMQLHNCHHPRPLVSSRVVAASSLCRSSSSSSSSIGSSSRRHVGAAARSTARVGADTDVEAAIRAAASAAKLPRPMADEELQQLVERLRANWYATAGDVAAASKEEVARLRVPVKLWALLQAMVAAAAAEAAQAADDDAAPSAPLPLLSPAAAEAQRDLEAGALAALDAATRAMSAVAAPLPLNPTRSGGGDLAAAFLEPLPEDIMQRRLPANLYGAGARGAPQVRVRKQPQKLERYGLRDDELSPALREELQRLERFSCGAFAGQLAAPLRPVSFASYARELRQLLGFAHRVRGAPLDQLSLSTLLPSPERDGVGLLLDYQRWRELERGVAPRSAMMPVKAAIALARFLYHERAAPTTTPPYRDVPVVAELAAMLRAAQKQAAGAPLVADESKKWLTWPEFLGLVRALRAECAGLTAGGALRPRREVAAALQRYLIVAILSVVPDRQRTLRELEVGRTLLRDDNAAGSRTWVIKHGAGDYKTGKQYGDRPPLVIAPFIYPELEAFVGEWRAELAPTTTRLFCKPRTGAPMDCDSLYSTFKKAALRLTGKATHPHLVRDLIVTHLRESGASEADMEALALLMGHSVKEQRSTYDRRTKAQRVTPAVELLLGLARGL